MGLPFIAFAGLGVTCTLDRCGKDDKRV